MRPPNLPVVLQVGDDLAARNDTLGLWYASVHRTTRARSQVGLSM